MNEMFETWEEMAGWDLLAAARGHNGHARAGRQRLRDMIVSNEQELDALIAEIQNPTQRRDETPDDSKDDE